MKNLEKKKLHSLGNQYSKPKLPKIKGERRKSIEKRNWFLNRWYENGHTVTNRTVTFLSERG